MIRVTIIIEYLRDGHSPVLWVNCKLIRKYSKRTHARGLPLENAKMIANVLTEMGFEPSIDCP